MFELMLEAVGSDLASEPRFIFLVDLGCFWQHLSYPFDDTADDLADACL